MLSPWPQHRKGSPYGRGVPNPPKAWRLVLFLIAILAAIYWLLRAASAGQ